MKPTLQPIVNLLQTKIAFGGKVKTSTWQRVMIFKIRQANILACCGGYCRRADSCRFYAAARN